MLGIKADLLQGAGHRDEARGVLERQLADYRALPVGQRRPEAEASVEQGGEAADRLIANTLGERRELVDLYAADPDKVVVVPPGVDLTLFSPGDVRAARAAVGLPAEAKVLLFVGRIQPLKAPEVLVKAAAELLARHPSWSGELVVVVLGGPSGEISAIDPATNEVVREVTLPHPAPYGSYAGGALWISSFADDVVMQVDATTGRVISTVVPSGRAPIREPVLVGA